MEFLATVFDAQVKRQFVKHVAQLIKISKRLAPFHHLKVALGCCVLCSNASKNGTLLCKTCEQDLPKFQLPVEVNHLLQWPLFASLFPQRHFDQLLCYSPYVWPLSTWLIQLKYHGKFEYANLFAELLSRQWQRYQEHYVSHIQRQEILVTCVPMHASKWQQRGFNQAHLIAKKFAKLHQLRYRHDVLVRTHHSESQVGQTGSQRRKNLKKAFTINVNKPLSAKHIILIDDVITTGTTVEQISRILKHHGVSNITVLTVALALPNTAP